MTLHEVKSGMSKFPQLMINVPLQGGFNPMQSSAVQQSVEQAENGTEPLIRVMVEGEDEALVTSLANAIATQVAQAAEAA